MNHKNDKVGEYEIDFDSNLGSDSDSDTNSEA